LCIRDCLRPVEPRTDRRAAGAGLHHVPNGADGAGAGDALRRGAAAVIGVAVIGLGAGFPPHAKSLLDLKDRARVVWAAAPSETRTRAVAQTYGFPVTTDIEAAIADPEVAAVLVLSPANTHLPLAESAFAAGKHVLCEKPLEASVVRAEKLVAAGRKAGRRLAVILQQRFRPGSIRLKQMLDAGELGEVQAGFMIVPWWRPQSYYDEPGRGVLSRDGGGVLITQAIHTLDLFRWLVGISAVDAAQIRTTALHRMETEDYAAALLRLGNGAPGTLIATVAAYPGNPGGITVIGSRGTATLEAGNLSVAFLDGTQKTLRDAGGAGSGANVMAFSHDAHRGVIGDFLDAIEQDRDPAIPGEEALATQRVIDDIIAKGV
jgi:predicted dehydrogenase